MSQQSAEGSPPPQQQDRQPGRQDQMTPQPETAPRHPGSGRLADRVALITGGDSGIGRAVAIAFAREGADVAVAYLEEIDDAEATAREIEVEGRRCLLIRGDVRDERFCREAVGAVMAEFGRLDILINNAAEQHPQDSIADISAEQLERTFATNVFAMFHMTRAALPQMTEGATIVNTASVTAYQGSPTLIDYSATKGAIVAFTRSLALNLVDRKIRVNAVAPGPIWTPLIPATFPPERVAKFGADTPMGRPGQPNEVAPCYVFLASDDSSYLSGQTLHPNGGTVVGS